VAKFRFRGHRNGFNVDVEGRDHVVIYAIIAVVFIIWVCNRPLNGFDSHVGTIE
jgi:hypothetical protein